MNKHLKMPVVIIIMLIHYIGPVYSQSEKYKFRHLTSDDGLPTNHCYNVFEDSRGFMWFTTRAGVCRYDGYHIKVFQYDPQDTSSIGGMNIQCNIVEDTCGCLWMGGGYGISRYNPVTEKFQNYLKDTTDSNSLYFKGCRVVYKDRNGDIWAGVYNGLIKYNYSSFALL